MHSKIKVAKPLVILHGDEMAQIAFERILEQFVNKRLDIELVEIDLTAENRLVTNGQAVVDAIAALKQYGVGVKNAGMTVNRQQLDELLARHPHIDEASWTSWPPSRPTAPSARALAATLPAKIYSSATCR